MKSPILPLAIAALSAGLAVAQQAVKPRKAIELRSPSRITVDGNGDLLVTDHQLRAVVKVDPATLQVSDFFSVDGRPLAVGWRRHVVYVGNETRREIQVFKANGHQIGTLGGPGIQVENPTDLAIDDQLGRLFAVDAGAKEIKVFDLSTPTGHLMQTISGPGNSYLNLQNPTGIAVDPTAQEVYVADYGDPEYADPRIIVFGYDGAYRDLITGDSGQTVHHFTRPQGLALGQSGHLFVTDAWQGHVVVMDRASNQAVGTLGTYGSDPGQLMLPLDIVIAGDDQDLFVTNNRPRRIEAFAQGGQL